MGPDRRNRISDLYHAALARAPGERRAFLTDACNGDEDLRQEVESLLQFEPESAGFLETPAANVVASNRQMPKQQIGPYTIVAPLGAGGMGEVYRARDTKLGRDVAIKILPAHFTEDPERRARFAREARLLATLNHPHIGAIYGLEESNGLTALVLELVEGPTLADRLERGPLKLAEALTIARQVAEALDAAHEKGIVHRDLKPANIVLQGASGSVSDLRAKVLDFGLAKALTGAGPGDATIGSDESLSGTADGRILGTPAYMSPEQARGLAVDRRTDIWAFGCVLFEMLTGRRAFPGDTMTDTLARILEREPDWAALPAETPPSMRRLLERCLRKDPRKRLRDIADALIEIDDATQPVRVDDARARVPSRAALGNTRRVWIVCAFVAGVLTTIASVLIVRGGTMPEAEQSIELPMPPPPGSRFVSRGSSALSAVMWFALAPDGRHMAFTAVTGNGPRALWVRPLGASEAHQLPGTNGAMGPFWSPDSRQIGFLADGKIKTISVSGGAATEICEGPNDTNFAGAVWSPANVIIFTSISGPIYGVASTGGTPTPVTALKGDDSIHSWPWFLPDGQRFLFLASGRDRIQLRLGSLTSTDSVPVGAIQSRAVFAAGYLLFWDVRGLTAQPFEVGSHRLGEPMLLVQRPAGSPIRPDADGLSVSGRGILAYHAAQAVERQLTWMDRKGNPLGTAGEPGDYANLSLSPDDRQVAASRRGADGFDIWVIDLLRNDAQRLTTNPAHEFDPTWSRPDGQFLIFQSNRLGLLSLFRRPADGSGRDELVAKGEKGRSYYAPDWSPDGQFVISTGGGDLWVHSADGSRSTVFLSTPHTEHSPSFAPDGNFIVYSSDQTGRWEIYVRPFTSKEPEFKISRDGGRNPRWRNPGEIVFLALDGKMMSARVSTGNTFQHMIPQPLFDSGLASRSIVSQKPYDVATNGHRFLIPVVRTREEAESITILTNWTERLRK